MWRRRDVLLGLGASLLAGPVRGATPASPHLVQHDLKLDGDRQLARRSLLLVPRDIPPGTKLPLLVLLHGLGETGNELLGIHAWGERYGLVSSHERLLQAPVERTLAKQRYLTDETRERLNASLKRRPFEPVVLACPVTPNPYRLEGSKTLDKYADWLENTLIPAAREKAPILESSRAIGLDGCSLGGYVSMEVFLRKPQLFGTFGGIQAAFGAPQGLLYAEKLALALRRVGPRPIHVSTSTQDPYRKANEALSQRLHQLRVPHVLSVLPGPHNQPWLREIGALELLLWHSRQLERSGPAPRRVRAAFQQSSSP